MIDLSAGRLAALAEGELAAGDPERAGPERAVIDSREVGPGDLFVGSRARARTAGASPPRRSRRARGACSWARSTARPP